MTKKKPVARKTASTKLTRRGTKGDYAGLLKAIESANTQMVGRAATVVNQALVIRNWLIGAYLVEYEQGGADRDKYGAKLLETLAKDLEARQIKGLGVSILKNCRQLFQMWRDMSIPPLHDHLHPGLPLDPRKPGGPHPHRRSGWHPPRPETRVGPTRV